MFDLPHFNQFFLKFKRGFLYFSLCSLSLVPSLGSTERSLALSFLPHLPHYWIRYLVRPAWDFCSPGWTISSLSASFYTPDTAVLNHLCGSSPDPLHWVHASLVVRSTALDPTLQICLTSAEQRGKIFSLNMLETFFQIQSRMSVIFFATRASSQHRWLTVNFIAL